jgi:hypothetical protein
VALETRRSAISRQPAAPAEVGSWGPGVRERLEAGGWTVHMADAAERMRLRRSRAKTDKIDARVLAELARRELVPEVWGALARGAPCASGWGGGQLPEQGGRLKSTVALPRCGGAHPSATGAASMPIMRRAQAARQSQRGWDGAPCRTGLV